MIAFLFDGLVGTGQYFGVSCYSLDFSSLSTDTFCSVRSVELNLIRGLIPVAVGYSVGVSVLPP